jgi:hypothetical protein
MRRNAWVEEIEGTDATRDWDPSWAHGDVVIVYLNLGRNEMPNQSNRNLEPISQWEQKPENCQGSVRIVYLNIGEQWSSGRTSDEGYLPKAKETFNAPLAEGCWTLQNGCLPKATCSEPLSARGTRSPSERSP